ncbi:hypothetical protein OAG75_00030 [bacterium]|nr:hypothetical protein [bacterium]
MDSSLPDKIVISDGNSQSGGSTISSPNIVVVEDIPVVGFTMVKPDGGKNTFGYFLIIRPPSDANTQNRSFGVSSSNNGTTAKSKGRLQLGDHEFSISFEIANQTEEITIDETNYDVSKGRVFLIDMQSDPAKVEQIDAELKAPDSNVTSTEQAEETARKTIAELKESSEVVAEFIGE